MTGYVTVLLYKPKGFVEKLFSYCSQQEFMFTAVHVKCGFLDKIFYYDDDGVRVADYRSFIKAAGQPDYIQVHTIPDEEQLTKRIESLPDNKVTYPGLVLQWASRGLITKPSCTDMAYHILDIPKNKPSDYLPQSLITNLAQSHKGKQT